MPREYTIDWTNIQLNRCQLQHLEQEFSEEEVQHVMHQMQSDKAPGPDGFIGVFYKSCWNIIKQDILAAVNYFYTNPDQHFNLLNTAHVVLLPKKEEATVIGDYRPISLSHSFTKLISKLMSVRLADELNQLVSRAQSAFIKRRSIHDNFLYTQNLIRDLHRAKKTYSFSEARHCKSV